MELKNQVIVVQASCLQVSRRQDACTTMAIKKMNHFPYLH